MDTRVTNDAMDPRLAPYIIDQEAYDRNHTNPIMMQAVDGMHIYKSGEAAYPSITTVLGSVSYNEHIVQWANSLGFRHIRYADELQKTAEIGTGVHETAQAIVDPQNGHVAHISDPLKDHYMRKRANTLRMKLELEKRKCPWYTIFTEKTFVSHEYGIAGTLDWFVKYYGLPTIGDFKSASGMREKFLYQLGGYSLLLDTNGIQWEKAMIILCKEDNALIHLYPKHIIQEAARCFLIVKDYYLAHEITTQVIHDRQYLVDTVSTSIMPETTS